MHPINHLMMFMIRLLPEGLVKPVAMRYIAGERLEDAIRVLRDLHSKKMMATVDVLGENVSTKEESLQAAKAGEDVLEAIEKDHLHASLLGSSGILIRCDGFRKILRSPAMSSRRSYPEISKIQ